MCGIVGMWNLEGNPVDGDFAERMLNAVQHRGPDDEGYLFVDTKGDRWLTTGGQDTPDEVFLSAFPYSPRKPGPRIPTKGFDLALGHRRLSILDLSPAGHQPMCNEEGTVWIVYNGEIYNFRELKRELVRLGHRFLSDTDTEVVLHGYESWGADCLNRFNGMWAFCIWDMRQKRLFCSRDRFGIKPFYYFFDGKTFLFSSEINALWVVPGMVKTLNERAVYGYLSIGLCDFGAATFFSGIRQLPSGQYMELSLADGTLQTQTYWRLTPQPKAPEDDRTVAGEFRFLFEDSVRHRLVSDVPVGTCLSGGLDSSSIVCIISDFIRKGESSATSVGKIQKTFSSRYHDTRHDEGRYIETVVKATTAEAHAVFPTPERLERDLHRLIERQGEPFASTSIFAQWCVFGLARQEGVKVTLDGQGADEILAGYLPYFSAYWAGLLLSFRFMSLARELLAYRRRRHPMFWYNLTQMFNHLTYALPFRLILDPLRTYLQKRSLEKRPHGMPSDFVRRMASSCLFERYPTGQINLDALLYQTLFYSSLPSYLRYSDRNSMTYAIESRVPFLDYRLVEFIFSLPEKFKIRGGTTKWVLREAMKGVLPELVQNRQDKVGFSTPEDAWFRGPLRGLVEKVISSESFASRPYFDQRKIRSLVERHHRKEINIGESIWRWINLELWMRTFVD